jgi:hypothetical protein
MSVSGALLYRRRVLIYLLLALILPVLLAMDSPALGQSIGQPQLPAPPRVFLDTSYTPPSGRTIPVAAGADLQAALNAARPGDTLALQPGAVFRGNFTLPKKAGDGWIVVRTGTPDDQFAPQGARVTPAATSFMPKIESPNSSPAISTLPGAHHYRFIGIDFTVAPDVKIIYAIVEFGGTQTTDADTPNNLIVDRCYVHGQPRQNSARGILLNSASSAVIDSHVSEVHGVGFDTQAILGYNGPGPFKIANNFLEGGTENILFGGADPKTPGLVPSDIEIRGNHLFKPMSWRPGDPAFAGIQWTVKNLLELKNAQRVMIEGNLLENVWSTAVVLTPRNQDGTAPWSVVRDVLFRNNVVKNATSGFVVQASDDIHRSEPVKRVTIVNNLWLGVTRTFFGLTGLAGVPLEDLIVDHNTAIPVGYSAYYAEMGGAPGLIRFRLTNNLFGFGSYGVPFGRPDDASAKVAPSAIILKNALINLADTADGQGPLRNATHAINQTMYTSFANAAAAGVAPDGRLMPTSPNRRAATDSKDIGVDFLELQRAVPAYRTGS